MEYMPFHQFQRYKMVEIILGEIIQNRNVKILEIGSNEHENLARIFPNADIYYLDIDLSDEKLKNPKYVLGDATKFIFEENEFDYVIALDVIEHVKNSDRKKLIDNIVKISKNGFILSFPQGHVNNEFLEKRLKSFFGYVKNMEMPWNAEHIENGLPSLEDVKIYFKDYDLKYDIYNHGSVFLFEDMMQIETLAGYRSESFDSWKSLVELYNQKTFFCDIEKNNDNSLRSFFYYVSDEKDMDKIKFKLKNMFDYSDECIFEFRKLIQIFKENQLQFKYMEDILTFNLQKIIDLNDKYLNYKDLLTENIQLKYNYQKSLGEIEKLKIELDSKDKNYIKLNEEKESIINKSNEEIDILKFKYSSDLGERDLLYKSLEKEYLLARNELRRIKETLFWKIYKKIFIKKERI